MKRILSAVLFVLTGTGLLGRPAVAEIRLEFENPARDQTVSGVGVISGWAFSTVPDAQVTVRLRIDGQDVGDIPCCVERADVEQAFPTIPQALTSGFGQVFNFNLLPGTTHTIAVEVEDDAGSPVQQQEHIVRVVRPGGVEFLSDLDLVFAMNPRIEGQEIAVDDVLVREKDTTRQQPVDLRLAWQENVQNIGIIRSDTVELEVASQSAAVQESVHAQTADDTAAIRMTFENPPDQTTVSGIGIVSGWAFPTAPDATVTSVRLSIDGTSWMQIPCCSERRDVANAFPEQPQALRSGFGAVINFNLLEGGAHTMSVEVQDSTGASQTVDHQVTVVKPGNFEFLDRFDLSEAGVFLSSFGLELDDVQIRDKETQQTRTVDLSYTWQESCQCFVADFLCGNGNVEPGEECDGTALAGATCSSLGFSGGTLGCTISCEFDTSQCTGGPMVYVTNAVSNSVSVVSTATNTVQTTIPVGREPRGIVVSPDATAAYVTNARDNTVSVIDTATNMVAGEPISVGRAPQGIAFSLDGTKAYVVNGRDDTISVINTATRMIEGEPLPVGREPQAIAMMPDGTRAYVTNFADNTVTVLDLRTGNAEAVIPVGNGPNGIAVHPQGQVVYVVNFDDDTVSVIDAATHLVTDTIQVSFLPVKVAFSPDGARAFVSNSLDFTVSVIDTATRSVIGSVFVGVDLFNDVLNEPDGVAVTPNGKRVYVALFGRNGQGDSLRVVSSITGGIVGSVVLGKGPFAVAVTPPLQP